MLIFRISAAALLIVGAGLVDGAWNNRWRLSPELAALTAKFDSVPMVIGDWRGTAFELPATRTCHGRRAWLASARKYSNPVKGVTVSVLLLGGFPAISPITTPEICYPGAGYQLERDGAL